MAANHEAVVAKGLVWASSQGWRLFKNVVGEAWTGRLLESWKDSREGFIAELGGAHRQAFGLLAPSMDKWTKTKAGGTQKKRHGGTSDLIGYAPVIITPEMVGRTIAVFTAVECKTPEYNNCDEDQANFLSAVARSGGIALVARHGVDGGLDLQEWQP